MLELKANLTSTRVYFKARKFFGSQRRTFESSSASNVMRKEEEMLTKKKAVCNRSKQFQTAASWVLKSLVIVTALAKLFVLFKIQSNNSTLI
jgi:hypothetical protein